MYKDLFKQIALTAMRLSATQKKDQFEARSIEIIVKESRVVGIKITPFSKKQKVISITIFEREGEILLNAKTKIALKFAESIANEIRGKFPAILLSTNLITS